MEIAEVRQRFKPAIDEITEGCMLTDEFVDKDQFRVYLATVWGNAVLDPQKSGIEVEDLEVLHDFLNEEIAAILGEAQTLTSCYQHLVSKAGQESLERLQIGQTHKDFIQHFAGLILGQDPNNQITPYS